MCHLLPRVRERQHGDVVFLAESLDNLCDFLGGLRRNGGGAVEAEELAGRGLALRLRRQ